MEWLESWGYIGLFIGTFLAATVVPFSADFLLVGMLLAGSSPVATALVGTGGNWLGGLTCYWIGWVGKWHWIEKHLKVTREKLARQKNRIDRHAGWLAFFSWIPVIGVVFIVGLGFYRVDFKKSAFFMLLGRAVRFAAVTVFTLWIKPRFFS